MDEPRAVSHPFWLFKLFSPSHSEQVYRRCVTTQLFKPPLRLKEKSLSRRAPPKTLRLKNRSHPVPIFGWEMYIDTHRSAVDAVVCSAAKAWDLRPQPSNVQRSPPPQKTTTPPPRVPILVPRRILSAAYFNLACVAFFPCCTEDILSPLSAKCL